MHWGWKFKPHELESNLSGHIQGIKYDGRTLLVPLEHYRHRDRHYWISLAYDVVLHTLAVYGLGELIYPYITRLWKYLS